MERQLTDLVQEKGATLRGLEPAGPCAKCSGKSAPLVPKQFALNQAFSERTAIDRNEGPGAPRAQVVNMACDQFFAGASFADDKDVSDTGRDQLDPIE
jgi:hypothetical protein